MRDYFMFLLSSNIFGDLLEKSFGTACKWFHPGPMDSLSNSRHVTAVGMSFTNCLRNDMFWLASSQEIIWRVF